MKKDVTLTIEAITDTDERDCLVTSPKQMVSILHAMADHATKCALYYNTNQNFIMTSVLDVDVDGMWIEQGLSATVNHLITESKWLTLIGSHAQVKVQFTVNTASRVTYDGEPALFLPLPKKLYRLQRREYFRLSLPPTEHLHCIIDSANFIEKNDAVEASSLDLSVSDIEIPAADISGGGIGLICMPDEVCLQTGETYSNCQINLPGAGPVLVSFTVVNLITLSTTRSGKIIQRAGCEFKDLDGHTTAQLQRYITDKQRDIVAHGLMI